MRSRLLSAASRSLPLVRDFIQQALYDPAAGYFAQSASPVGRVHPPIDFNSLAGREGYQLKLHQLYAEQKVAWITPSELFTPVYGAAIGDFILRRHARHGDGQPLRIVEVGGGNGTLAADILTRVAETAPGLYAGSGYATLEISAELADRQRRRLEAAGHGDHFSVRHGSALNARGWGLPAAELTYVVLCEVLDNLPHDKVVFHNGAWLQTHVDEAAMTEVLAPLSDPLIVEAVGALGARLLRRAQPPPLKRLASATLGSAGSEVAAFAPTGALQFLRALHAARPNHCLLAADFDFLPEVTVEGANAPLVSAVRDGVSVDFPTYLVPRGTADIFFPTDFPALQQLYVGAAAAAAATATAADPGPSAGVCDVNIWKSADLFAEHGDLRRTALSGSAYNPLRDDFSNTSIFVGSTAG